MTKYEKTFKLMIEENEYVFNHFKEIQDKYFEGEKELEHDFNVEGTKVMRIIRRFEDALCSKSENTRYGKFSESLSDKFWELVRAYLPHIDEVKLL